MSEHRDQGCAEFERLALKRAEHVALTEAELAFEAAHLAGCADCRRLAEALLLVRPEAGERLQADDELALRRQADEIVRLAAVQPAATRSELPARRGLRLVVAGLAVAAAVLLVHVWFLRERIEEAEVRERTTEVVTLEPARVLLAAGPVRCSGWDLAAGEPVQAGQIVEVGSGSAVLQLAPGLRVMLGAQTTVRFGAHDPEGVEVSLRQGRILAGVASLRGRPRLAVLTEHGRVQVSGTRFAVLAGPRGDAVQVIEGAVLLQEEGQGSRRASKGRVFWLGQGGDGALPRGWDEWIAASGATLDLVEAGEGATLKVDSSGVAAQARLDGVDLGPTPVSARAAAGEHMLALVFDDGRSVERRVALTTGQTVKQTVEAPVQEAGAAPAAGSGQRGPVARLVPDASGPAPGAAGPGTDGSGSAPGTAGPAPDAAGPAPDDAGPAPDAAGPQETARSLLARARQLRLAADWFGASLAYRELMRKFPDSPEAETGIVSLSEIQLDNLGTPAAALESVDRYLARSPRGSLAPEALLIRGRALGRLGRTAEEVQTLKTFLERYPSALQAEGARKRLEALRAK